MPSVQVWILAVALGSFGTGMLVGAALPELLAAERPATPEQAYVEDFAARFGLTAAQRRSLALVLQESRREELEILSRADWAQLSPELRNQRLVSQRRTELRVRQVLDPEQRARYDRDSRPELLGGDRPQNR